MREEGSIIVLRFVRVDYSLADSAGKSEAVLIYDCKNSLPKGFNFSVGQEVFLGDLGFTVRSVTPLCDGRLLHHIEVGLSVTKGMKKLTVKG